MESLSKLIQTKNFELKVSFKSRRDEIISKMVEEINKLREGTAFRKETKANLAKRINMNPFLKGKDNDGELELLYKECHKKNNYSLLYWTLKNK